MADGWLQFTAGSEVQTAIQVIFRSVVLGKLLFMMLMTLAPVIIVDWLIARWRNSYCVRRPLATNAYYSFGCKHVVYPCPWWLTTVKLLWFGLEHLLGDNQWYFEYVELLWQWMNALENATNNNAWINGNFSKWLCRKLTATYAINSFW